MQAYGWLCNNYKDGDKLFFFGFSRGAYQVRALAGMVEAVGLLSPGNNHMIPYAFEDYYKLDDTDNHTNRSRSACDAYNVEQHRPADMFKHIFTRKGIRVHFVGVWDTVSSVGTGSSLGFRRGRTLPLTTSSCDHICYFRHALALDERRVKFLPEYVYGGRAHFSNDDHIKEVWFPGSHSDVGGGNKLNPRLQSSEIPLLWMRGEASMAGLRLEPCDVMWRIDDLDKPITRLERQWWVLEVLPLQHLRHNNTDDMTSM
ncbi:hypothetical protein ID866_4643 [Astraeus odoratus]|nr:hypothetical protein ID866_4643 [Astraeus odoratus]